MKNAKSKITVKPAKQADKQSTSPAVEAGVLVSEAFLEEANKESRRSLLMDHVRTIIVLRDQKRFTFRAIAEWLGQRGVETDHSAVYRVYTAAIPEHERDPFENWEDVDEPGYADENVEVKTKSGK